MASFELCVIHVHVLDKNHCVLNKKRYLAHRLDVMKAEIKKFRTKICCLAASSKGNEQQNCSILKTAVPWRLWLERRKLGRGLGVGRA